MCRLGWIARMLPRSAVKLVCCALGIGGVAFLLAVSGGVDSNNAAGGSQGKAAGKKAAPPAAATDQPQEAPTGFNNATNGFEPQDAFNEDREAFEEVETIADG